MDSARRAEQIAAGLTSPKPGGREHALLKLAELWFPPLASCFRPAPPHAMPTAALISEVARLIVVEARESIQLAAVVATANAWRATRVVRGDTPIDAFDPPFPGRSIAAIGVALSAKSNIVRINAARLIAEFPIELLVPQLQAALEDPVWTVRWNAVTALAVLRPDASLLEVLRRSQPRAPSHDHRGDFQHAVSALERRGLKWND